MSLPGSSALQRGRGLGEFGGVGMGQQPFAFPEEPCVCAGRGRGTVKL